jgi:hypothetical protein
MKKNTKKAALTNISKNGYIDHIIDVIDENDIIKLINSIVFVCLECNILKTSDNFHKGRKICITCYRIKCNNYYLKKKHHKLDYIYNNISNNIKKKSTTCFD